MLLSHASGVTPPGFIITTCTRSLRPWQDRLLQQSVRWLHANCFAGTSMSAEHTCKAADWIRTTGVCLAAHAGTSLDSCIESNTIQIDDTLMYDVVHGTVPGYLRDLCRPCGELRLRSGSCGDYILPFSRLSMTQKSFRFSGPRVWISLPSGRVTFAMPLLEQCLLTDLKRISSNMHILEMCNYFVRAAEPWRGVPSK